jgi:hypothetical protein
MIELRWRKAESESCSLWDTFGNETVLPDSLEPMAIQTAQGEFLVLQYKWTPILGETGLVIPMSSEWEDVPVATA